MILLQNIYEVYSVGSQIESDAGSHLMGSKMWSNCMPLNTDTTYTTREICM